MRKVHAARGGYGGLGGVMPMGPPSNYGNQMVNFQHGPPRALPVDNSMHVPFAHAAPAPF